ncbi:hypothetical protein [Enterococcus sp. BWB1-3]|nr:hypothetical protein [Enterococcus sp. BWB1-3]
MRLIEKITDVGNIERAINKVKSNKGAPGSDNMTVEELETYF